MATIFEPKREAKKRKSINPLTMYMREQRPIIRRKFGIYNDKDLATHCVPLFQKLSPIEKERYQQMAKEEKERQKVSQEGKLNNEGIPILQIVLQEKAREKAENERLKDIKHFVTRNSDFARSTIYMIHVNLFLEGEDETTTPAELAIVKYSIGCGIIDSYHVIIDPGQLPYGSTADCKSFSDRTHQLPVFDRSEAPFNKNYADIYTAIKRFVRCPHGFTKALIFAPQTKVTATRNVLKWLEDRACAFKDVEEFYDVYDLDRLMLEVYNSYSTESQSIGAMRDKISSSSFNYTANISCDFHEERGNVNFCSLSIVKCYAYILSDLFCGMFNVKPIPDVHMPKVTTRGSKTYVYVPGRNDKRHFDEMSVESPALKREEPNFSGLTPRPSSLVLPNQTSRFKPDDYYGESSTNGSRHSTIGHRKRQKRTNYSDSEGSTSPSESDGDDDGDSYDSQSHFSFNTSVSGDAQSVDGSVTASSVVSSVNRDPRARPRDSRILPRGSDYSGRSSTSNYFCSSQYAVKTETEVRSPMSAPNADPRLNRASQGSRGSDGRMNFEHGSTGYNFEEPRVVGRSIVYDRERNASPPGLDRRGRDETRSRASESSDSSDRFSVIDRRMGSFGRGFTRLDSEMDRGFGRGRGYDRSS